MVAAERSTPTYRIFGNSTPLEVAGSGVTQGERFLEEAMLTMSRSHEISPRPLVPSSPCPLVTLKPPVERSASPQTHPHHLHLHLHPQFSAHKLPRAAERRYAQPTRGKGFIEEERWG